MTASTTDRVDTLAAALHDTYCLLGARSGHTYSRGHIEGDARWAAHLMARLAKDGLTVSPIPDHQPEGAP
ncbi:hypothetical protein AB0F72_09345 [Actinoplanes sp. NPDC023936]|uniref:hypothetical protein n=1 Tax=Actinoplanes sp. NPDC023936 TaxID=3154910 RepID=UPI0033C3C297